MTDAGWLDEREAEAWQAVRALGQPLWTALGRDLQRDSGLSLADYEVLVVLSERADGTLAYRDLAEATGWEKSRLSHHVTRMQQRDLVRRVGCAEDARSANVVLTPAGRRAIERAAPGHVASVRRLLVDRLSPDLLSALAAIGRTVREALDGCGDAAGGDADAPESAEAHGASDGCAAAPAGDAAEAGDPAAEPAFRRRPGRSRRGGRSRGGRRGAPAPHRPGRGSDEAPMAAVLILGGTAWFGRTLAERAVAAGHGVTCLARGSTARPPEGAEFVRVDRRSAGAYREIAGRNWDLVVEISWQPGMVRGAVEALGSHAASWVLISSCSVYARDDEPDADERAALAPPVSGDDAAAEDYAGAKVACEQITTEARQGDAVLLRAGLIGGDGDGSDRTGYWPGRCALADGGPVLVPERGEPPVQIIDVRDLADFAMRAGLDGRTGPVNAVGERVDLARTLGWSREVALEAGFAEPEFVAAKDDWLAERAVAPWAGPRSLPLWLPGDEHAGFAARSDHRALDWGLRRRPLVETLAGALAFERRRGLGRERRAGLARAEELELVRELR